MQTVSIAEAQERLTELIKGLEIEPLIVVDGDQQVAFITSPLAMERERRAKWESFWKKRDAFAADVEANLAKDGLTVDQFLADFLSDA